MTIHVTPIPQLVELAAPAFTLGTANAAGSAATAVASDSTLLVFDTTDPAAVAASAVVGSATTAPRRDHVHPGIVGAGTVVDEAIARFDGTSGDSLQGYSSLSPTISNAGIITLTSGALKFPATMIASADANTLDDYETGTWSPAIADDELDGTGEGQSYDARAGFYCRIGSVVTVSFDLRISSIGSLTTSDSARIVGLPFAGSGSTVQALTCSRGGGFAITAGNTVVPGITAGATNMKLYLWSATTGTTEMTVAQVSADGTFIISGSYLAA